MFKLLKSTRKTVLFAGCFVFVLFAVALTLSVKTSSQRTQTLKGKDKADLVERIEKSADQPLKVLENEDSPLRVSKASVKEISGEDFTKLTGKTIDLLNVASVPEANLVNNSDKTIVAFAFAVRDPETSTTRTVVQRKVSIAPGGTYSITRGHFLRPEKTTEASSDGLVIKDFAIPGMESEKFWMTFGDRAGMFVTVGHVTFDDRSTWKIKEGGEIK